MTTETDSALIPTSAVDPEIAAAIRIHDRLVPVKEALGISDLSDQEVSLFAMVAQRSRLDPFARQIYAIKRSGKVSYQTGIDGYRSIAARTGDYGGSEEATFEEPCPCGQGPEGHPAVARVVVHRIHSSGKVIDQVGVARWHELYPGSGDVGRMWQKMPLNQLAKCAEANGLRKLFPTVLADIYIAEEMEQAGPAEDPRLVEAASQPKASDRIAARRAAIEATVGEVVDETGQPIADNGGPDLFEGMATTDQEDGAASASAPAAEVAAATSAAPSGYQAFRARFLLSDPHPSEADVRQAAKKHERDIPDLSMKQVKDWPLTDSAWVALGDALNLPQPD